MYLPGIIMDQTVLQIEPLESDAAHNPSASGSRLGLCPRPLNLYRGLESESLLGGLIRNVKDAFFPTRQPPLRLTSSPVAVVDPLHVRRDPRSSAVAFVIHALIIAFIIWMTIQAHRVSVRPFVADATPIVQSIYMPPIAKPAPTITHGGGGAPHAQQQKPIAMPQQVEQLNVNAHEVLRQPQAVHASPPSLHQIVDTASMPSNIMPTIGSSNSPQVALASSASGTGSGNGQGIGSGIGAGSGGGLGGGVMSVGGGVSAPVLTHSVQPELTNQARQTKYQGVVAIQLIVDANGNPVDVHVVHHLGRGLDEKAVEAVQQYKFKPAMYQGHPVAVRLEVNVNFHVY